MFSLITISNPRAFAILSGFNSPTLGISPLKRPITFFDSLEHFDDLSIIGKLDCNYILLITIIIHKTN